MQGARVKARCPHCGKTSFFTVRQKTPEGLIAENMHQCQLKNPQVVKILVKPTCNKC